MRKNQTMRDSRRAQEIHKEREYTFLIKGYNMVVGIFSWGFFVHFNKAYDFQLTFQSDAILWQI